MYFMKNSRSVLRKSQWFSSNVIERNLKISLIKSRGKWPEDDPTKPPLRLNIPKDTPVPSPYNFTSQIQLNTTQSNINTEKLGVNWQAPEVRSGPENDEIIRKSTSSRTLEESRYSSKIPENPKFSIRSKSSESLNSKGVLDRSSGKKKNFKLKKIHSYEELTPETGNEILGEFQTEGKSGILTIKIALNDHEDEKLVTGMSQMETEVDVTSDENIKALAEAIVNELNPNTDVTDGIQTKSTSKQDEAFLVIINITDKDIPEDTGISAEKPTNNPEGIKVESLKTSFEDGYYGTNLEVRNLDLSDEGEKNVGLKNLERSGKLSESDTPMAGSKQVTRSLKSVVVNRIKVDAEFDQYVTEQVQGSTGRGFLMKNRFFKRPDEDLDTEKEKRKQLFETTIQRIRATRSHIPIEKKMQIVDAPNKLSSVPMDNPVYMNLPPPVRCVSKFRTESKITQQNLVGEVKDDFTRKEVPTEVTAMDLPDMVLQPEYKMLRKTHGEIKNIEDDKFKKSNAIRSYHNSCKNLCKLTNGIGGEKLSIVVMNLDKKSENHTKDDEDNPKDGHEITDPLRLADEYSRSKLDNPCDALNKNIEIPDQTGCKEIRLQEENVVNNKLQESEEKKFVQKTKNTEYSKNEEDYPNDDRYELDIADLSASPKPERVKMPNSTAYQSNRKLTGDERTRSEILRDLVLEPFELNLKCLNKDETSEVKPLGDGLKCESPMNTNTETTATTTPKISDNIANIANESLTKQKGPTSVDSLSMMKRVKEMVDMDLKNAEKIFMATDVKESNVENQIEDCTDAASSDGSALPKSVVIHNEATNQFYIKANELEHAANIQKQELALELEEPKILDFNQEVFKGDLTLCMDTTQVPSDVSTTYILKSGDSILVYDEKNRKWNVDFGLLQEKEQKKEELREETMNDKWEINPSESERKKPKTESKDVSCQPCAVAPVVEEVKLQKDAPDKQAELGNKDAELRQEGQKEHERETDAKEIQKKNFNLYENVFIGMQKEEGAADDPPKEVKKADGIEKPPSEHYVSENIVEMSKNNLVKPRFNKVETVKLDITPKARPPSKVMEINLNKKNDEGKESMMKKQSDERIEDGTKKQDQLNGTFYKKFEKYNTPFSDLDYEDKPMKINSDLKSNPNLKKLDSWTKTLVLQEITKPPDNVEGWLRDETDKMATLLLKVLQDAADGNTRRRVAGKMPGKGNPYEAIRKKQENNSFPIRGKKKDGFLPARKRMLPVQAKKPSPNETGLTKAEEKNVVERPIKGQFPIIEDDSSVEILTPDSHLPKEPFHVSQANLTILNESLNDDIPGPFFLKKMSSLWRYLPDLGCQTTIFLLIRLFHLAKTGLSAFLPEARKSRRNPFERLFMKYGPVVKLHGPLSGDVLLINRPEDLKSVFTQAKTSPARSVLDSIENCRVRVRKKNIPLGITQSCIDGEWENIRKSMIDVGNKGCLQYFNMLKRADTIFVQKIQSIRNNQKQVPDDFITEVKKWSMEGLCGILFDKSLGFLEKKDSQIHWIAESERLMRHLGEATDYLCQCESSFQTWRFFTTPAMTGLNQAYQSLDLILSKYVYQAELTLRKKKKALTNDKSNFNKSLNFLESVLLNDRMAPDEITANLIDMLVIGVNTTTVALAFLLYNLAQNNRVQCLLFKEVKDLLPTKTSSLNYHQLHSLKYLQACLKESMRLNVPIPLLLRVLPSDIALANYRVPFGTHVVMDTRTACMKEQTFEDPQKFKPERWLEQDCVHPFASVPFSNGPRSDFVKRLAEIHLWTCITQIVRNYQIEYHFGDIRSSEVIMSYPDKPLRLTFIDRTD